MSGVDLIATAQEVNLIELIIMSLLVILSVEASPGKKDGKPTDITPFMTDAGEAVKSAGAHDKGSW